jgi:hypothetical protein
MFKKDLVIACVIAFIPIAGNAEPAPRIPLPDTVDIGHGVSIKMDLSSVKRLYKGTDAWIYLDEAVGTSEKSACEKSYNVSGPGVSNMLVTFAIAPERLEPVGKNSWRLKPNQKPLEMRMELNAVKAARIATGYNDKGEVMCITAIYVDFSKINFEAIREKYMS